MTGVFYWRNGGCSAPALPPSHRDYFRTPITHDIFAPQLSRFVFLAAAAGYHATMMRLSVIKGRGIQALERGIFPFLISVAYKG